MTKFSGIATPGTVPAATDTILGVAGGTTDVQTAIENFPSALGHNPCKFSVYRNASWTTAGSGGGTVPFDTVNYDTGSNFSTSTGLFTATIAGYYRFAGGVQYVSPGNAVVITGLAVNGSGETIRFQETYVSNNGSTTQSGGTECYLTIGETVGIFNRGASTAGGTGQETCWFTGSLFATS